MVSLVCPAGFAFRGQTALAHGTTSTTLSQLLPDEAAERNRMAVSGE
jgi:hypothetical protein